VFERAGLATHAPAIVLIREKVVFRGPKQGDAASKAVSLQSTGEFILLHVDLLRRYLDLEFRTMVRMHACMRRTRRAAHTRAFACLGAMRRRTRRNAPSACMPMPVPCSIVGESQSHRIGPLLILPQRPTRPHLAPRVHRQVLPFAYSLEAVIDDLLVLAFLVGNDFLPHVPLLQVPRPPPLTPTRPLLQVPLRPPFGC